MTKVWIAALFVCAMSSAVRADDDEDPPAKGDKKASKAKAKPIEDEDDAPTKSSSKSSSSTSVSASSGDMIPTGGPKGRVTLPGGKFIFNVVGEANMAKGAIGKPSSVGPDLWLGVADKITFGIVHSGRAATGFLTGFGSGLCFRGGGSTGACSLGLGDVYTFAGAEIRLGLTEGGFATALVLGGQARAFDPKLVATGKAGILARINSKILAVELEPTAYIGITQRKVGGMDFNRDEFGMPVTIFLRFAPGVALALQSGVTFTLKKPGDTYRIPAAVGLAVWAGKHVSIDAAFGLAAVADKDTMTKAFDNRSASVGVGYAY